MGNAIMLNGTESGGKKLLFEWTCSEDDFDYTIPLTAYDITTQTWTTDGSVDLTTLTNGYSGIILPTDAFAEIDSIRTNNGYYSVCTGGGNSWQPGFKNLSEMVVDTTHIKHSDWSPTEMSKIDVSDYALYVMNIQNYFAPYLVAHNLGGYDNYCIKTRLYRSSEPNVFMPRLLVEFNTPSDHNSVRNIQGYVYASPAYDTIPPIVVEWSSTYEKTDAGWLVTIEDILFGITNTTAGNHAVKVNHYKTMSWIEHIDWSKDFDLINKRGLLLTHITPGDTIRIWGWNN